MTSHTRQPIIVWPTSSAPPAAGSHAFRDRPMPSVDRITTAAEAHRLDRQGGHAGFGDLDREVVLVARLVGPLATLFVDADDVVHTAAVARHANHHSGRAAHFFWKQEIREHADAGLAVEHDLLAHVTGKCACLECDRAKRRSSRLGSLPRAQSASIGAFSARPRLRRDRARGIEAAAGQPRTDRACTRPGRIGGLRRSVVTPVSGPI